jgi:endoglycosylceramidase
MIKIALFFIYSITQLNSIESKFNDALNKVKLNGNYFVDNYGRVKLFHGANYIKRGYPWYPEELTNQTMIDNLKTWGFNSVRLGVMWSGLRPDIKTVNITYLNIILKMIDDLSDRGIYVIIDLHQDWMSSKFGSYDGFPRWLVDLMPNSTNPYPWPFKSKNLTLTSYLTDACGFAFQNLYSNVNKFEDYFLEYWTIVVNSVANRTSVLAYEIINEPWSGDIYSNPNLLLPGNAGKYNLLPFYDNVYKTIRKYDNETLVMYEPVIYGNILNGKLVGTGFDRPPGNDSQRTILAWHYYCKYVFFCLKKFIFFILKYIL